MDSPTALEDDKSPAKTSDNNEENGNEDSNRKKANARKRTKTGCLTCRKRRIKCDEGRPICNNCIKSKRHCEGYNQRVIFKDPIASFNLNGVYGPVVYPPESSNSSFQRIPNPPPKSSNGPPLAPIAPKPPQRLDFQGQPMLHYGQGFPGQQHPSQIQGRPPPLPFDFNQFPYGEQHMHSNPSIVSPASQFQAQFGGHRSSLVSLSTDSGTFVHSPTEPWKEQAAAGHAHVEEMGVFSGHNAAAQRNQPVEDAEIEYMYSEDDESMPDSDDALENVMGEESAYGQLVQSRNDGPWDGFGTKMRSFSSFADEAILTSYIPTPNNSPLNDERTAALFWHFINVTGPSMSLYERHPFDHSKLTNNYSVPKAGHNIWTYTFPIISFTHPALLQAMLALGALQIAKLQKIPPTAAMKHYHLAIRRIAKNLRSPKRRTQPATLAASLLLGYFEVWNSDHTKWCNHLFGSRLLIREVPFRQMTKNILPLKRTRRALFQESQSQPLDPFFMGHDNTHMVSHDLDDLDLGLLSKITNQHVSYEDDEPPISNYYTDRDIEHYEHLRDLYWWYCKMDVYQSVLGGGKPFMDYQHWTQCPPRAPMGRLEAIYGTYDHLMLLLGRLCSFASKDLPRKRKSFKGFGPPPGGRPGGPPGAPPGAPINAGGPPQGGSHVWPPPGMAGGMPGGDPRPGKMGGIPDGMSGGPPGGPSVSMPPAGMMGGLPGGGFGGAGGGPPPGMMPGGNGVSPPMFPGMLPNLGKVTLPMGFSPPRDETPPPLGEEAPEELDSDMAASAAMREWESLREAFEILHSQFGPEFQPLGAEYADRRDSPFGPTLQYRTFSVAGIWMNYYMGLIHLYRAHPKMPPAAMIAAGIQAQHTAKFAMEIGRIAAGLTDDCANVVEISTLVGAALIESSFCLFVGGIQYQDNAQRQWIVRRMFDIARLTGWQSARQIAEGCESGWKKAAAMGRGPPYARDPGLQPSVPPPVWSNPRRIGARLEQLDSDDSMLVVAKSERAFYALGLLSVEQELERLVIKDEG
ncbi:hypothetical protein LZ32DRAFT_534401 [Colletotrichum eremochloae]|nr:hypothetical protein LZ32DRAFT_534401 [Colletotrichum eremochloae]